MASEATQSAAPVHRFILLTDIAGSSRLAEQYGRAYLDSLERHNQLVKKTVTKHDGMVYKQTGDGYLVLFETADACLKAALELGEALGQLEPLADDEPLLVRLALHAGALQPSESEYFGPALNRVSRICQVCNPGQVLMSGVVAGYFGGAGVPARNLKAGTATRPIGFQLIDLGQHHLRDLSEPEQLYELDSERFSRREFPPLTTLNTRSNNLVRQPNHFIGREKELQELAGLLLDDTYLLSIVAPGGYGKSRLAAQLCANLLHRFERGVFIAYLAPVRESPMVPAAIANALGFNFSGSREPEDQLCDYLREKELLLCLDNFEHVMDCAPFVRKFLDAAPKLKIVVTSREPLRLQGEHIYRLEPLPVQAACDGQYSEAEALFADRAALVSNGFALNTDNAAQVQQICEKLSGIPLAIELAAAWMDTFALGELSEELSKQLELEARASDRPERHQSLKACLDWSWNLLGEEQQGTLMRLSTFRGGFFNEAAFDVLGIKGMKLRSALGRLADKSWLFSREVNGQARFFLRDMLAHEFAFAKLQQSELFEPAVMAHAAYFSALMAREGPRLEGDGTPTGQSEALSTLLLEQQNIEEAMDTLLKRLRPENTSENAAALLLPIARNLWKLLEMSSALRDLVERYRALNRVAEQIDNLQQILLHGLLGYSNGQVRLGAYEMARDAARQARHIAEFIGDLKGVVVSLNALGTTESRLGNSDAARERYAEALAIGRDAGDRYGIAISLNNLGLVELSKGGYEGARELCAESLAIMREIGNRTAIAAALGNLAGVEYVQGNYEAARALTAESLNFERIIGNRYGSGRSLQNLGLVELRQGNYDAAHELCAKALAIRREIGDRYGIAASLGTLGAVEVGRGNYDAARELHSNSLAIAREIGNRELQAFALHALAVIHVALEECWQAEDLVSQTLGIRRDLGDRSGMCVSLVTSAYLIARRNLLSPAAVCLYGAQHNAPRFEYHQDPNERDLLERATEIIEHPETGLAAAERGQLKEKAESMSLDELAEFALTALAKLEDFLAKTEIPRQSRT